MRLLLIRHAEPDYEHNTITEKGKKEAILLGDRLAKEDKISAIYVSPLSRAIETAQPAAKLLDIDIIVKEWLTEFQGKIVLPDGTETIPWNLLPSVWGADESSLSLNGWKESKLYSSVDTIDKYDYVIKNFDEMMKQHGYTRDGVIYRCDENKDETVVICCHFGVGMVIASHITGVSPMLLWQSMFLPTSSVTEFITEERVKGEAFFKCKFMGDTSHLYANDEPISNSGLFSEFYGGEGMGAQV